MILRVHITVSPYIVTDWGTSQLGWWFPDPDCELPLKARVQDEVIITRAEHNLDEVEWWRKCHFWEGEE